MIGQRRGEGRASTAQALAPETGERALVDRASRGDRRALAQIFDTHHDSVYRYIRMRVSGDALAEDLSAEVFTRLLQAFGKGKGPRDSLRGWLYGVAAHCVADHHRREGRARKLDPEHMTPAAAVDPEHSAGTMHDLEGLSEALGELTDDQQQVIALRYGSEMKIRDVAALMGRSEGAIKQLQARAVARLAELMSPPGGEGA